MKKSFTLIEMLISITILSLLMVAIAQSITHFEKRLKQSKKTYKEAQQENIVQKVLYYDLLNATSITIETDNDQAFDHLKLQTSNSLYGIAKPYVWWYVAKKGHTLVRIESPIPIEFDKEYPFIDPFMENLKGFKIYRRSNKIFVFIAKTNALFFELRNGTIKEKRTQQ